MYRTGDLGRWSAAGELEFLGRIDDQVKLAGIRVEPGEVEAALLRLSHVHQAAVIVENNASGNARLRAYVGTSTGNLNIRVKSCHSAPSEAGAFQPVEVRRG